MKTIRRWFYIIFKRYRRLDIRFVSWQEADTLIRANGTDEKDQWVVAREEDHNRLFGYVFIERRERIT